MPSKKGNGKRPLSNSHANSEAPERRCDIDTDHELVDDERHGLVPQMTSEMLRAFAKCATKREQFDVIFAVVSATIDMVTEARDRMSAMLAASRDVADGKVSYADVDALLMYPPVLDGLDRLVGTMGVAICTNFSDRGLDDSSYLDLSEVAKEFADHLFTECSYDDNDSVTIERAIAIMVAVDRITRAKESRAAIERQPASASPLA
jgi:hypothetical protein